MRKPMIAGNWKMYKTRDEALYYVLKVSPEVPDIELVDTVICAQAPLLHCLIKRQGEHLRIGAQNIHPEDEGAFTGEVSGKLLKSYQVEYVIIGHSERRNIFQETDDFVNQKIHAALRHQLKPIVCIGEMLSIRQSGQTNAHINAQIEAAFRDVKGEDMADVTIAYEPIWAIGTGQTATPDMANETCGVVREKIKELYGEPVSQAIRILYGGSVKRSNIDELCAMPEIDGALIGGASLDPDDFLYMAHAAIPVK